MVGRVGSASQRPLAALAALCTVAALLPSVSADTESDVWAAYDHTWGQVAHYEGVALYEAGYIPTHPTQFVAGWQAYAEEAAAYPEATADGYAEWLARLAAPYTAIPTNAVEGVPIFLYDHEWESAAIGGSFGCVLRRGDLECKNMADATFTEDPYPEKIAVAVAAEVLGSYSDERLCVLYDDGSAACQYGAVSGEGVVEDGYTGSDGVALAVRDSEACVLTSGGDVYCDNILEYAGGDAVQLAAGPGSLCLVTSAGAAWCDGSVVAASGIRQVAVGDGHRCLLTTAGNVDCSGSNTFGQADDHDGGDAASVLAYTTFTCILTEDGNTFCQGGSEDVCPPESGCSPGPQPHPARTTGDVAAHFAGEYGQCWRFTDDTFHCSFDGGGTLVVDENGHLLPRRTSPSTDWPDEPPIPSTVSIQQSVEGALEGVLDVAYGNVLAAIGDPKDRPPVTNRAKTTSGDETCVLFKSAKVRCTNEIDSGYLWADNSATAVDLAPSGSQGACILWANGTIGCRDDFGFYTLSYGTGAVELGPGPMCYLRADGTGRCSGHAYSGGDAVAVAGLSSYGLPSLSGYGCFVLADGDATCLGPQAYDYGGRDAVQALVFQDWNTGAYNLCVLRSGGDVACAVLSGDDLLRTFDLDFAEDIHRLVGSPNGMCMLTETGRVPCMGGAGDSCFNPEQCVNANPNPNPYPDLVPLDMSFGVDWADITPTSCWFYAGGRSYCSSLDGEPATGQPDRIRLGGAECVDEQARPAGCG